MNEKQAKTLLGVLTGIAFLVVFTRSIWLGQPLSDRSLAVFAVLLWAYLQVDITAILPFAGVGERAEDDEEED